MRMNVTRPLRREPGRLIFKMHLIDLGPERLKGVSNRPITRGPMNNRSFGPPIDINEKDVEGVSSRFFVPERGLLVLGPPHPGPE
jgi:hypothetical protein